MVEEINGLEQLEQVVQNNEAVIVDVWAAWCGPCRMIAPIVEAVANENSNIKVVKVDADVNKDVMQQFGIRSIPTLLYFKNGALADKTVGAVAKNTILEKIKI